MIGQIGALFLPLFAITISFLVAAFQGMKVEWTIHIETLVVAGAFLVAGLVTLKLQPAKLEALEKLVTRIQEDRRLHETWAQTQTLQFNAQIAALTAMHTASEQRLKRLEDWVDHGRAHGKGAGVG